MSLATIQNKQINGLIFDLDGVIADTAHLHYRAWCQIASRWGFHLSEEQNEELKGVSRSDSIKKITHWAGKDFSQKELNDFAIEKNSYYLKYCESIGPEDLLPGVLDFIKESSRAGLKLAVGSASRNANIILNKLGILNLFKIVVDGNMVENSKPHPEVFLKSAAALNILPEECVVFEDSQVGIQAAVNAKMFAVGIGTTHLLNCDARIQTFEKFNLIELSNQLKNYTSQ